MTKIIPVILNGGSGTRLWPISRQDKPKQFHALFGDETLFQSTVKRAMRVTGTAPEDVVTITLAELKKETLKQALEVDPSLTDRMLTEPEARNTAAAYMYTAQYVSDFYDDDALIWALPSDHHIENEIAMHAALQRAIKYANKGHLVTFGIQPTHAETGYGYISTNNSLNDEYAFAIEEFIEKPPLKTAQEYFESGDYLWASGMHLFKASSVLNAYKQYAPETAETVRRSLIDNQSIKMPDHATYKTIKKEPFEIAILEKAKDVVVVPCDIGWSDVGTWRSLWELSDKDEDGNVKSGRVVCKGTKDTYIRAHGNRMITCLGVNDLIITDTGDTIMIADKNNSDLIKNVVSSMKDAKTAEVMKSPQKEYMWGRTEVISNEDKCKLCEIVIVPKQKCSVRMHNHGDKMWFIANGEGLISINGQDREIKAPESFTIPAKTMPTITNNGNEDLKIFEFQYGDFDDNADIIRFTDQHGKEKAA